MAYARNDVPSVNVVAEVHKAEAKHAKGLHRYKWHCAAQIGVIGGLEQVPGRRRG